MHTSSYLFGALLIVLVALGAVVTTKLDRNTICPAIGSAVLVILFLLTIIDVYFVKFPPW